MQNPDRTTLNSSNVLIIDDEENLRKLLARVVELEGYTVYQAASIKEGIRVLDKENINIVVSDVKLPDGNGVELVSRIKQDYPVAEVIVLTAYGTIEDGVKAIKNGAFDYLTKSEHPEKNNSAVKQSFRESIAPAESI